MYSIYIIYTDEAPLTRKDVKTMKESLSRIERDVTDLKKKFEMSGVGDITSDGDFINVSILFVFFFLQSNIFLHS
jgi:hypothetical protein